MGSITDLLGKSPRVAILEAFAEHPELEFSVPEIVEQTGVSKRGAYLHIARLLEDGIITRGEKSGKCQYYKVNEHDRRGEFLTVLESVFTLGKLEREIKRDLQVSPAEPLVRFATPELPEFQIVVSSDPITPETIEYSDVWTDMKPNLSVWLNLRRVKQDRFSQYLEYFMTSGTTANETSVIPGRSFEMQMPKPNPSKLQVTAQ